MLAFYNNALIVIYTH